MNEKLHSAVATAVHGALSNCDVLNYLNMPDDTADKVAQAATAAHSAFIREAADKSEVKEAGARVVQERFPIDWDDIDPDDQREAIEWAEISFHAMLDQIERTPDEG